ncbi:Com family DNA-binding transcriptional regulator [Pseudoalteromonas obscura]|uniref:Com family DNA-binding transcriptional regulator n=1 Tax=Pseudoalteromonas obscura TaxID=3048491 RepID=UPI003A97F497
MQDVRCTCCDRLLCRAVGVVEIKCPRCKTINVAERPERHEVKVTHDRYKAD